MTKIFKYSLFYIIFLIISPQLFSIDKVFLKYTPAKRQEAIRYATEFWHQINDQDTLNYFKNFGGQFNDPVTNKIYNDCYSYGLHPSTISGMCKGDCANFVSQCLIVGGGFNDIDFTRTVSDKSHLGFSQPAITIAHAGTLKDHLINLGAYNNNSATVPNEGGGTRILTIEDLQPGDGRNRKGGQVLPGCCPNSFYGK